MARNPDSLPAIASINFLYMTAQDMPWARIEMAAGKPFSANERKQIHACTDKYSWEFGWIDGAAPIKEINSLHKGLLQHCDAICRLAEKYQPQGKLKLGDPNRKVLDNLAVVLNAKGFDLHSAFSQLAKAAQLLSTGLKAESTIHMTTTAERPENPALCMFLVAILEDAEEFPARGNSANQWTKPGVEYSRWGLSIGPRCVGFPEFVSEVLGKQITEGQLKKIWPRVREELERRTPP